MWEWSVGWKGGGCEKVNIGGVVAKARESTEAKHAVYLFVCQLCF